MNKDVWSYFKHFGRLLGKFIFSLLPARLMKRFPASKGHLQPDLLGSFLADVGHRAKFSPSGGGGGRGLIGNWVWPKGYIYPFSGDGVGGGERLRGFWQIAHSSYPTHQITSDTHNFPISKDILFCPNLPAAKIWLKNRYFEEQIHWVPLARQDKASTRPNLPFTVSYRTAEGGKNLRSEAFRRK